MCFTAELSKRAMIFGILSGVALIVYGKPEYSDVNNTLGAFFIFISLVQYIEYLIWTDLECKNGNNELAGTVGPLIIYLQPVVLCVLALALLKRNNLEHLWNDYFIITINAFYFFYIMYKYNKYLKSETICSGVLDNHIKWVWDDDASNMMYSVIMLLNILYFMNNVNGYIAFGLTYLFLFISYIGFNKHVGEIWCYLSTSIPIILLACQRFII